MDDLGAATEQRVQRILTDFPSSVRVPEDRSILVEHDGAAIIVDMQPLAEHAVVKIVPDDDGRTCEVVAGGAEPRLSSVAVRWPRGRAEECL